jgi:hypothetical protein
MSVTLQYIYTKVAFTSGLSNSSKEEWTCYYVMPIQLNIKIYKTVTLYGFETNLTNFMVQSSL